MILQHDDGAYAHTPDEESELEAKGYKNCYGRDCKFFLSPETQQNVLDKGSGYYSCPNRNCYRSFDLMEDVPWHGSKDPYANFEYGHPAGGGTRIGLNMEEQAQIGEDLVRDLGSIPGYGPIVWWHPGHAGTPSPLDGATRDWGIEVKTIGYDARNHRFIVGKDETETKNAQAEKMKLQGVLGVLVLLNYRTSKADVYVKEMPLEPWKNATGRTIQGVASFRSNTGYHLLEEIPFKNPFAEPLNDAPQQASNLEL